MSAEHFTLWESPSTFVGLAGVVYAGPGISVGPFSILGSEHGALEIGANALIRSHSVIEGDVRIGPGFECGHHVLIRHGARIGRNVRVGSYASVEGDVDLEEGVRLGGRVQLGSVYGDGRRLRVGRGARLYLGTLVLDNRRPPDGVYEPPLIGEGASIGAGCLILPGAVVAGGVKVPAGSVVR